MMATLASPPLTPGSRNKKLILLLFFPGSLTGHSIPPLPQPFFILYKGTYFLGQRSTLLLQKEIVVQGPFLRSRRTASLHSLGVP